MSTVSFKDRMEKAAKNKNSNIIVALDFPFQDLLKRELLLAKARNTLKMAAPYVCAVKINHHLTLPLGIFDSVKQLVQQAHASGLQAIMDCKVNDIGATNQVIAEYYFAAGFDALIANPFVGWEEGLKPIFETAHRLDRGVILLTYMSHKGAAEGYGQTVLDEKTETKQYLAFAKKALQWNADGAVVGATVPEKIREIYAVLGEEVPIYSPGVGAQGGTAEAAVKAGARYLIIGREITQAQKPEDAAAKLKAATQPLRR